MPLDILAQTQDMSLQQSVNNEGAQEHQLTFDQTLEGFVYAANQDKKEGIEVEEKSLQLFEDEKQRLLELGYSGSEVIDRLSSVITGHLLAGIVLGSEYEPAFSQSQLTAAMNNVVARSTDQLRYRQEIFDNLTDAILRDDLSYRDVLGSEARSANEVAFDPNNAVRYAQELTRLTIAQPDVVSSASESIRYRFEYLRKLLPVGVSLSPYADSNSWILWDIAKQEVRKDEHYFTGKNAWYSDYSGSTLIEPSDTTEVVLRKYFMQDVVAWRHFGWELHQLAMRGEDVSWMRDNLDEKSFAIVTSVGDDAHRGMLSSADYTDIGRSFDYIHKKKTQSYDEHSAASGLINPAEFSK